MPAYSTDWIKRLNQLGQVDPDAVREIEQRADAIYAGYSETEVYSRGGRERTPGAPWTDAQRSSRARAMEQAFQEYERMAGATAVDEEDPLVGLPERADLKKKNYKMPLNRPYDDPQEEAAIQQIMQQQGVDRAEAIRIYRLLAEDPQFPLSTLADTPAKRLGPLSALGEAGRPKPGGLMAPGYTGFGGSVRGPSKDDSGGGGGEDEEGYIGPGEKYVEPSAPKVAPGEELVRDTSPQMSGGQELYGEAATQREPLDTGLGILGALATAGGAYFTGRDTRAAEKRQAQGTASANLINALAGNIVAQAPRTMPSTGVGTSMMKGLATASGEILRQREAQRALDQQSILTKITQATVKKGPKTETGSYYQAGVSAAKRWKEGRSEDEFYVDSESHLPPKMRTRYAGLPSNIQHPLLAEFGKGFTETRDTMLRQNQAAQRINLGKNKNLESQLKAYFTDAGESDQRDPDSKNTFEGWHNEFAGAGDYPLTQDQTARAEGFYQAGRDNVKKSQLSGTASFAQVTNSIKMAGGQNPSMAFANYAGQNPGYLEWLKNSKSPGAINAYMVAYQQGQIDRQEALAKAAELPAWAMKQIADLDAGIGEVNALETMWLKAGIKGPIVASLVPVFQLFSPDSVAYDRWRSAFVLKLAAVINDGRPSDKDAIAIDKMVPGRHDTPSVAATIFQSLRDMMEAKRKGITDGFELPVWEYVEADGFDYESWKSRQSGRILTETEVAGMVADINSVEILRHKLGDVKAQERRDLMLGTLDMAGVKYKENEDGTIETIGTEGFVPTPSRDQEQTSDDASALIMEGFNAAAADSVSQAQAPGDSTKVEQP